VQRHEIRLICSVPSEFYHIKFIVAVQQLTLEQLPCTHRICNLCVVQQTLAALLIDVPKGMQPPPFIYTNYSEIIFRTPVRSITATAVVAHRTYTNTQHIHHTLNTTLKSPYNHMMSFLSTLLHTTMRVDIKAQVLMDEKSMHTSVQSV